MARPFSPKVVTANDLLSGDVVYLDSHDCWVDDLSSAALYEDEAEAQEKLDLAGLQINQVVGVYLAGAKAGLNGPEPVHFREEFRAKGPSNYAHGKQVRKLESAPHV